VIASAPFPEADVVSSEAATRKTPLHGVHVAAGARMVPFAGWEMPVQYTGVVDEHLAVRTRVGLFDVSHMGEVRVTGSQALAFVQHVTCNDVSRLAPGRIQYSGLMTPQGTFVDDLLVHKLAESEYFLVINAGNTSKDVAWLLERARAFDCRVVDESERYCQLALQGPHAAATLAPLTDADLAEMKYYGFARAKVRGIEALVTRTGYTGEDGFEIYAAAGAAETLWHALLQQGAPHGLVPVGLGARDTLRLEAKMALYGNDIDDTTTVLEADLGWICKLDKGEFLGRDVLVRQKAEGVTRKLVGFETEGRAVARHGFPALRDGAPVGTVTSGTFSPFLKKNIGLAYLPAGMWDAGTRFDVEIRGRREPAVVVPTPFYKRTR
jgi:aminomethyltransferase